MRKDYFAARAQSHQRRLLTVLFAMIVAMFSVGVRADDLFFDWRSTSAPTPVPGYIPAPIVDGTTNPATLGGLLNPSVGYKAIKVTQPLSAGQITGIYGAGNTAYKVNYAFFDLEGAGSLATFGSQVAGITAAQGGSLVGKNVYVGNFDVYPIASDSTRAPGYVPAGYLGYAQSGANMATEALYPGSPTFRTKTTSASSQSNAPNIRSALFALPITRLTMVEATLPSAHMHIPFVNRFNNYGNNLLNDAPTASSPFRWTNPTGDQMLSRGDFKAMVAHYRMRGADGYHLLDGGVEGYTQAQFQQDAKDGWNIPQINSIFTGGNAKLATLDTTVTVGGNIQTLENAGLVFSGVYSLSQNGGKGKLALLVSNMVDTDQTFKISSKIGGKGLVNPDLTVRSGHTLLEFTGAGTQWQLASQTLLFTTGSDTDRTGVGVPEPVAMGTLSLFALMMLSRRRNRA